MQRQDVSTRARSAGPCAGRVPGRGARSPPEAFTDSTPTDPAQLRRILAAIRREGSACCPGYLHPGATGIAAPVLRRGKAVATLSVVVLNVPQSRRWEPLLRIAAATVTRRLDGTG